MRQGDSVPIWCESSRADPRLFRRAETPPRAGRVPTSRGPRDDVRAAAPLRRGHLALVHRRWSTPRAFRREAALRDLIRLEAMPDVYGRRGFRDSVNVEAGGRPRRTSRWTREW